MTPAIVIKGICEVIHTIYTTSEGSSELASKQLRDLVSAKAPAFARLKLVRLNLNSEFETTAESAVYLLSAEWPKQP